MGVAELVQVRTTRTRQIQESKHRHLAPELCAYLLHLPTLLSPGLYFPPVALALSPQCQAHEMHPTFANNYMRDVEDTESKCTCSLLALQEPICSEETDPPLKDH